MFLREIPHLGKTEEEIAGAEQNGRTRYKVVTAQIPGFGTTSLLPTACHKNEMSRQ